MKENIHIWVNGSMQCDAVRRRPTRSQIKDKLIKIPSVMNEKRRCKMIFIELNSRQIAFTTAAAMLDLSSPSPSSYTSRPIQTRICQNIQESSLN